MKFRAFLRNSMRKELGASYGKTRRAMRKRCQWATAHGLNHVHATLHNIVMIHLGMYSEVR